MEDENRFIEAVECEHELPGWFLFKLIGDNRAAVLDAVLALGRLECPGHEPRVTRRESSGGRHQGISLELHVRSGRHVLELYARLGAVDGIRMVL